MAAKRHERTSARRAALQVLYTSEITDESPAAIAEGDLRLEEDGPLPEYAHKLVLGVESHRCAIDNHLAATSENWSLARMPIVDRSILRLATFEMMYVDDVPTSVTINEAVELAKDFGGEDESHRFVNGILGRIAKMLEGEEDEGAESEGDPEVPADGDPEVPADGDAASDGLSLDAADTACDQVEPFAAQDDKSPEGELSHGA